MSVASTKLVCVVLAVVGSHVAQREGHNPVTHARALRIGSFQPHYYLQPNGSQQQPPQQQPPIVQPYNFQFSNLHNNNINTPAQFALHQPMFTGFVNTGGAQPHVVTGHGAHMSTQGVTKDQGQQGRQNFMNPVKENVLQKREQFAFSLRKDKKEGIMAQKREKIAQKIQDEKATSIAKYSENVSTTSGDHEIVTEIQTDRKSDAMEIDGKSDEESDSPMIAFQKDIIKKACEEENVKMTDHKHEKHVENARQLCKKLKQFLHAKVYSVSSNPSHIKKFIV
jgi:hypothetical protein